MSQGIHKLTWPGIVLIGLTFAICGAVAHAQQANKVPQIGFLVPGSATSYGSRIEAFRKGLHELNYREGQNVNIEYRYAEGKLDRLTEPAAELMRLKVDDRYVRRCVGQSAI
jgi:putative ABC transport system substrate-binding protein